LKGGAERRRTYLIDSNAAERENAQIAGRIAAHSARVDDKEFFFCLARARRP